MVQLLVAHFPQPVIVSELVAGSLRHRQDGLESDRRAAGCVVAAVALDCKMAPKNKAISTMRHTQSVLSAFWLSALVVLSAIPLVSQIASSASKIKPFDLDLILQRIEDVQHQNLAQSQPYEVTREYKVFRGYDSRPTSEVIARIIFIPPDVKSFKIVQASGNTWGARIIRDLLSSETSSTRKEHSTEISRDNYDFIFLRQQNFGDVPEYVFAIFPKRKDKYLLRGQIWVEAHSFRIRQIEGVPAKSPSFWLKNLHITLQYGELGGMWVPVTFDAIATVRILGEFTLDGLSVRPSESLSADPK
jgi:hypothetical protein